jgi:Winged helix DNA-binding domain
VIDVITGSRVGSPGVWVVPPELSSGLLVVSGDQGGFGRRRVPMGTGARLARELSMQRMGAPDSVVVVEQQSALRRVLGWHHLLEPAEAAQLVEVAEDVVGLHATSASTPYLSVHARTRAFDSGELDDALYGRRSLVRLKAMRGTVFVWSLDMAPLVFAATRAATVAADRRWLGINGEDYEGVAPRVLAALAGQSLTVGELRQTLEVDADVAAVVAMLCDEGRIVRDRPVGGRTSNAFRYRHWADAYPDVFLAEWDETDATRELLWRYVNAYGPVSRADAIWWTGLPARRVDDALHSLQDELVTVAVGDLGDRLLMTTATIDKAVAIEPGPIAVNLVPMLDPYTMGYRDRSRLFDSGLNELLIDRGGNVTSVVLIDGRVAGVWDLAETPNPAARVLLFDPDDPRRERVLERAADAGAFWFGRAVPVEEYESMVALKHRRGVMRRPLDDAQPRRARRVKKRTGPVAAAITGRGDSRRSPSRTSGGSQ